MSESSKMGLFGSKDKTKELKKEAASKEESPDRYAPYCIDSDSETYDTEALSIMDINDIIGVHSEPVGESTLESEIAALSQIITESKTEPTRSIIDTMSHVQDKEQIDTVRCTKSSSLGLSEPVDSNSGDITSSSSSNKLQMSGEKSVDYNRLEVTGLNPSINTHSSSSMSIDESCTKDVVPKVQNAQSSNKISSTSDVSSSNFKNNSDLSCLASALTNIGGINQSLQLIGEAYISDDSQESSSNDNETRDDMDSNNVNTIGNNVETPESEEVCKAESSNVESTQEAESVTTEQQEVPEAENNSDVTHLAEALKPAKPTENNDNAESITDVCLNADDGDKNNEVLSTDLETTGEQQDSKKEIVSKEQKVEETDETDWESTIEDTSLAENVPQVVSTPDPEKESQECTNEVNDGVAAMETKEFSNIEDETCVEKSSDAPTPESTVMEIEEKNDISEENPAPETTDFVNLIDSEKTVDSTSSPPSSPIQPVVSEVPESSNEVLPEVKKPDSFQNDSEKDCDSSSICTSTEKEVPLELEKSLLEVPNSEEAESSTILNDKQSVPDTTNEVEEQQPEDVPNNNICDTATSTQDAYMEIVPENKVCESTDIPESTNSDTNEGISSETTTAVPLTVTTESEDNSDEACKVSESEVESTTENILEEKSDIETDSKVQEPQASADATVTFTETFEKSTEDEEAEEREALNEISEASDASPVAEEKSDEVSPTEESDDTPPILVSPSHSTHRLNESECPVSDADDVKIAESEEKSEVQDELESEAEKTIDEPSKESQHTEDVSDSTVKLQIHEDITNDVKEETYPVEVCAPIETSITEDASPVMTENNVSIEEETKVESASTDDLHSDVVAEEPDLGEIEDTLETDQDKLITIEKEVSDPLTNEKETIECEDEADEEASCDDLDLTLEPDESELHETGELDLETVEPVSTTTKSVFEEIADSTVSVEKEGDSLSPDVTKKSIDIVKPMPIEESTDEDVAEVRSTQEPPVSDKIIESIVENQDVEETLKPDVDDSNLKSILETTDNAVQMFAEEQCQNTQDIMTSILDNDVTDFKNILGTENSVENDIDDVLQHSSELPNLVEGEIEELAKKLPGVSDDMLNKDMEEAAQNIDSLEGLLGLDLMPENEDSAVKEKTQEISLEQTENIEKDIDMSLLLDSNRESDMQQDTDYITDVISSCLTNDDGANRPDNEEKSSTEAKINDKAANDEPADILKMDDSIIDETIAKESEDMSIQKELIESELQEADLDMDFEGNPLESVEDLDDEQKLDLSQDILLGSADQTEGLNDPPSGIETSQPSSEISELESAVKFLQESEEQGIDSPLVLSPKMVEGVVDDMSKQSDTGLFVPDEDICEDTSELVAELQGITSDSISISEAEIISEAAKLENERKLAEQAKLTPTVEEFPNNADIIKLNTDEVASEAATLETTTNIITLIEKPPAEVPAELPAPVSINASVEVLPNVPTELPTELSTELSTELPTEVSVEKAVLETTKQEERLSLPKIPEMVSKVSESLPKTSILEERLKEPPKIEIPVSEVSKICSSQTTPKDSLLIQKDAKMSAYQKMLESPKLGEKGESRITDTPRKESEKHDFENVGSPRIILKIVKSAIAECSEPRSPKSPKIRSATNSPNPEDSPGQKLGKIKLKLSKGGHPSIISNENIDESAQWHTEGSSSLSPIGMKIKLSKSGDVSIVSSEKHDSLEDSKEIKRTESPIGMKFKLSKSGDASIVQDCNITKHKEKLDMMQSSPKRTESPIGMKIKLSRSGDASIIQPDKQESQEEHKESSGRSKDKLEMTCELPKRTDSPIGMKIKLSKTGDASIIPSDLSDEMRETMKIKEKLESSPEVPKRTESPIGMKIKLAKTKSGASIISVENTEECKDRLEVPDVPKRTESPLGMKFKLSKSGDASIIHSEVQEDLKETKHKEKSEPSQESIKQIDMGVKIKVTKVPDTTCTVVESMEQNEMNLDAIQRPESSLGMKIKLSKTGDASIIPSDKIEHESEQKPKEAHPETPKRTESPLGMKIKLSKTGDASIIQSETIEDPNRVVRRTEAEYQKAPDSAVGMKIKLVKTGDASLPDVDKKEKQSRRRDVESPLEMKIKLSKTGHPTIVACDNHGDSSHKSKEVLDPHNFANRYKESLLIKEPSLKILKTGHSTIMQSNRSELTIEPVQMQSKKLDPSIEISPKRKEITISPIESKKSKLEAQLSQILPEVTIQPVMSRDQKQLLFDPKTSLISRQQMNVISQEISITQVRPSKPGGSEVSMSDKLKDILCKNVTNSPLGSDCEIIEHRPELIIVNENSNSSQDVVIIEEVPPIRMPEAKVPKKRGRPRRNPLPPQLIHQPTQILIPRDPLALDETPPVTQFEQRENERPKRTCRNQKSYAPPKRGRGRGRGKRKLEAGVDLQGGKKARVEQDLSAIESSTMAVITLDEHSPQQDAMQNSSELYKALKQPTLDRKSMSPGGKIEKQTMTLVRKSALQKGDLPKVLEIGQKGVLTEPTLIQLDPSKVEAGSHDHSCTIVRPILGIPLDAKNDRDNKLLADVLPEREQKPLEKTPADDKVADKSGESGKQISAESKDILTPPGHPNWLTPTSKKPADNATRSETMSTVQVIDEETRMSAESGSRSQTPARNISAPATDQTIVNEESQGSVLSTATTESEKVKVKNRRMEINFDPDEGPFTVDKIAEYEWPLDRKGETFMIQEQISQYLGVKSFKRKYPDLKRRMVDMEERNYLRENCLVSEAMCDMGLTAVCSSEVLDVMCSDFPDQYEEYRKHMREKQIKEHSKKQKELTAAANAEKNRIDLAEMAVQSALSWNVSLNKARNENRKCSLDLQTFTIHVPKKQQKVETDRKLSHYPVALIPGQYTDYYREYTPAELRYYPLNTVLYGPMRPNERKFDSQSEGSQSDSDSDSSSDDSSSSSSEGTQDTEGSQSTMDDVDMEIATQKEEVKLKCKMCLKSLNKHSKNEVLIQCGTCGGNVHPSCIDLTLDMVPHIQSYAWQCTDCKTCAQCHDPADEDKMLFCDMCDRGYHIYCVGLRRVPQGRWHCQECAVCANCGSREPGGANSDRNSVAQWQHEYKKGDKNTRVYVSTLCVPCSKLWRKGRYCPHCSRCHTAQRPDLEVSLVHCSACDKYLHLGCVETKGAVFDRKNYLCDFCAPNRQHHAVKPLISKTMKT